MAGTDPFSWAKDFAKTSEQHALNDENYAQNALLNVFKTEAARQQPYSDLPVSMALQNNASQNSLNNAIAGYEVKQALKPGMATGQVAKVIRDGARAYGADENYYMTLGGIESQFNTRARNKSGASGLFQFMPKTAAEYGLDDPSDPNKSMAAAIKLTQSNKQYLESQGLPTTPGTLYLAHQQGAAGATKLLKNPQARAVDVLGRAAVLQNGGNVNMSAGTFAQMWMSKFDRQYKQRADAEAARHKKGFGIDDLKDMMASSQQPQSTGEEG